MRRILISTFIMLLAISGYAQDVSRDDIRGLDEQIQDVKKDVISLTSELAQLEEKLLFPSNTQAAFFVSIEQPREFELESLELKLGGEVVAHHLYTYREIEALRKGGVQKLHVANVQSGSHPLRVKFIGKTGKGREVAGEASYAVKKEVGPKFVEIKIADAGSAVNFRDW